LIYLIKLTVLNKVGYFLWGEETYSGDDLFYLNADGNDFACAATLEEITAIAQAKSSEDNLLSSEAVTQYNFETFWQQLSEVSARQHSNGTVYKYLLNGWNHLENFARSIEVDLRELETADNKSNAEEVYQKLIWADDLLASAAGGKVPNPIWSELELAATRQYLVAIWRELRSVSNRFSELTDDLIK
jgi:hypothetical protein